jgi:acylphosphatase
MANQHLTSLQIGWGVCYHAVMTDHTTPPIEELYARVYGYVQGVGFRYFVVREAQMLGLRGYARNESDGSVEVLAQGPHAALERLLVLLRRGPSAAHVRDVRVKWGEQGEHFGGFYVRW